MTDQMKANDEGAFTMASWPMLRKRHEGHGNDGIEGKSVKGEKLTSRGNNFGRSGTRSERAISSARTG